MILFEEKGIQMELTKELNTMNMEEELNKMILAGAFFGSGGGGSIEGGKRLMEDILSFKDKENIRIIDPKELTQGDKGAVVALMGSPLALEKAKDLSSPSKAFETLEAAEQKNYTFCLPIELGAVNSLVPLCVAARKKILVINGDGAGRAVPQLGNTTFAAHNISVTPSALSNTPSKENPLIKTVLYIDTDQNASEQLEIVARNIVEAENFGNIGGLATFPMNDQQIKTAIIPNTYSILLNAGNVILVELKKRNDPLPSLLSWIKANLCKYYKVFTGEVTRVTKPKTQLKFNVAVADDGGGFDVGIIEVTNKKGEMLKINYMNENLYATLIQSGDTKTPWAMAPDLICMMTPNGPVTNVEIEEGMNVHIVGIACFDEMRNSVIENNFLQILKKLEVYDGPYIPIEKLPSPVL